jgi:hypothetical protein
MLGVRALVGDPRCHTTKTDAFGLFSIDDLQKDDVYSLMAGKDGFATSNERKEVKPGGQEPARLEVEPIFGVTLRLLDEQNASPRLGRMLPPYASPLRVMDPAASIINEPSYAGVLAGGPPSTYPSVTEMQYLFTSADSSATSVGPLAYEVNLPGYEPKKVEFSALPLAAGMTTIDVHLLSSGQKGTLGVYFAGVSDGMSSATSRLAGIGTIVLYPDNAPGVDSPMRVLVQGHEPLLLEDLPYGNYRIRYLATPVPCTYPPYGTDTVTISSDSTEWVIDMTAFGAASLDLQQDRESRYAGPVSVLLMTGEVTQNGQSGKGGPLFFESPPYILSPLAAGAYTAVFLHPKASKQVFSVRAGEVSTVRAVLSQ